MIWPIQTLGELCSFENGDRGTNYPSKSVFVESGIPFVNAGHLEGGVLRSNDLNYISEQSFDKLSNGKFKKGDFLFCLRGTLGKFGRVNIDMYGAIASSLIIIRHGDKLDPRYLNAYLASDLCSKQIDLYKNGAAQPNLAASSLRQFEIPLPPLEEQKRIAAILDQADELRRKRQCALNRLNQLGQAIFIEMFGDLGASGIDVEPLGLLTSKIGSGATPKGGDSAYKAEGIPLIRSMNVRDGHFLDKGLAFIDDEQASKLDNVVVKGGDVLLNITGASVARVCTAPASMDGARVNQHVSIIRPTQRLLSVFVEAYLLLPLIKKRLLNIAESGATRQAITKAQIEQLAIPVPPIRKQQEFAERVGVVQQALDSASVHHVHLVSLFGSLQHRAFRGELAASSLKEAAA